MNTKPRISVLMGIYNCANTLPEAIDSLYAQTYKNFKLILCDDGSTDNTYEIAKEYASKYDNIVLLKNEKNIKLAATLNRCLEYADTEYIARMDGDDISLPTRFEKQIDFVDSIILLKEDNTLYNNIANNAYNMIKTSFNHDLQINKFKSILNKIQ